MIGLGSNLGDRRRQLELGAARIAELGQLSGVSYVYETPALGPPQPDFYNAATRLLTLLSPRAVLDALLEIERELGRVRRERWGPRTLDLDLLWGDGLAVSECDLEVPHPGLTSRAFALLPLLDVAPEATEPSSGRPYSELAASFDPLLVQRRERLIPAGNARAR